MMTAHLRDADEAKVESFLLRCGLCGSPEQAARAVATALGVKASTLGDLLKAVHQWQRETYASESTPLSGVHTAVLEAAKERGMGVAFLSAAPETAAQSLFRRLEPLAVAARLYVVATGEKLYPTMDHWRSAAQACGGGRRNGVALVSTRCSFKSALAAGLRCVAAPSLRRCSMYPCWNTPTPSLPRQGCPSTRQKRCSSCGR